MELLYIVLIGVFVVILVGLFGDIYLEAKDKEIEVLKLKKEISKNTATQTKNN